MLTAEALKRFKPTIINPQGVYKVRCPRHYVYGLHVYGASDLIAGIGFGDVVTYRTPYEPITGTPAETTDAMRLRALLASEETAPRDEHDNMVGYFIYAGLPVDHCRKDP